MHAYENGAMAVLSSGDAAVRDHGWARSELVGHAVGIYTLPTSVEDYRAATVGVRWDLLRGQGERHSYWHLSCATAYVLNATTDGPEDGSCSVAELLDRAPVAEPIREPQNTETSSLVCSWCGELLG